MTACGCPTEHQVTDTVGQCEDGEVGFYVSIKDPDRPHRYGLLLGPFDTHDEALANVALGRELAHEANPREAAWAAFGTCKVTGKVLEPGRLNELAAKREEAA